jgi:hypothetical protein
MSIFRMFLRFSAVHVRSNFVAALGFVLFESGALALGLSAGRPEEMFCLLRNGSNCGGRALARKRSMQAQRLVVKWGFQVHVLRPMNADSFCFILYSTRGSAPRQSSERGASRLAAAAAAAV